MCKDLWRWINANPAGYDKPDKEFGAFKQATFQSSTMPTLSSSSRRSTPAKQKPSPPGPGGITTPTRRDSNSSRETDGQMRGRGTSMDDLLGGGAQGDDDDDASEGNPFNRGTSMDDLLGGDSGGSGNGGGNKSAEVGVGESF